MVMRIASPWRTITRCRHFHHTPSYRLSNVESTKGPADLESFRKATFIPEKPHLLINHASPLNSLPAASKWFSLPQSEGSGATLSPYLKTLGEFPLPYEVFLASSTTTSEQDLPIIAFHQWLSKRPAVADKALASILDPILANLQYSTFFQIYAPLDLLKSALEFNKEQRLTDKHPLLLYIAQCSLSDLPQPLRDDLPTPELVQKVGRGDIYNSSIWLGTEPTYTPLHRDPNPNLFSQLCGGKVVRLLPPDPGDRVFHHVQRQIQQNSGSRIRTKEMMEGKEREVLHEIIWGHDNELVSRDLLQAELESGDSLFIPKGWWHSVKSRGSQGCLNGSVNWWFR